MIVIDPDQYVDGPRNRDTLADAWAWANRDLRDLVASPHIDRVLVTIGVPGSGKSTLAMQLPHDDRAVLFDACHADAARRRSIVRRVRDAGKLAIGIHVCTPLCDSFERNALRTGERRVPDATMRRIALQLRQRPPSVLEGWSDLRRVTHIDRTAARAKRFGLLFYRWRTKGDDRVRPEHRARHGRLFAWMYPPEGGHPAEDYGCRCEAADVDNDDVVETRGGDLRARPLTVPKWARQR